MNTTNNGAITTGTGLTTLGGGLTVNGTAVTLAGNSSIIDMTGTGTLGLDTTTNRAISTGTGLTTLGGALTVSGTTVTLAGNSSVIDMTGTGTLSLDTTTNKPIATGTGLTTLGGALTVSGTTVTLAGNSSIIDMTGTGTLGLDTTTNRAISTGTGLTTLGGALTVSGTTVTLAGNSSVIDMTGTGTLSLDTTTNRPIATGTGLTTLGGGLTVTGAALTFAANSSTLTLGGSINTTALNIASNLEDFDTQNKRIGINTNAPLAALDVRPNLGTAPVASISGNTAFSNLVIDQSGTGDLFTASNDGKTKFVVKNSGQVLVGGSLASDIDTLTAASLNIGTVTTNALTLSNSTASTKINGSSLTLGVSGFTTQGGLLYMSNGTGSVGEFLDASANQCLISQGVSTAPAWGACETDWAQASGAIVEGNTTEDLLLGGTATTSADFAFEGVDSNNPTASISAVTNGGNGDGLSLASTNATIQSLNNNTLTIGGATTGNIIINSPTLLKLNTVNNGAITTGNGLTTLGGGLTVNGTAVTLAGNSSIIDMTGTGTLSLDTTTNRPIATGTGLTTLGGALTVSGTTVTLAGNSSVIDMTGTGTLSLDTTTNRPIATGTGLTTLGGALTVSGTTVTLAGNSSVIDMTGTGTLSLDTTTNRPIATGTGLTTLGGALTVSGTTVTLAGNSSVIDMTGTGTLSLDTTTNRPIATGTGLTTLGGGLTVTGAALTFAANSSTLTLGGSINTTALNIASNLEDFDTQNKRIGINTNAPLAALDVRASSGSTPVASISGNTAFSNLIVDQSGTGDLFTASKSGAPVFTITNAGGIGLAGNQGSVNQCLQSNGAGQAISWGSCGGGGIINNFWQLNSGAIDAFSTTADLLLGGTATTSADFAFTGVDSNNPTASISAVTNGGNGDGLSLASTNATIQSLNNNTLTIGGATTGNIVINSPTLLKLNTVNNGAITTGNGLTTLGGGLTVNGTAVTLAGNSSIIDMTGTGTLSLDTTTNRPIATGTGLTTLGGALTVSGTTVTLAGNSSIIDMTGTGTLGLDTTTNRAISTGTGLTTLGGALTVSGTTVTLAGNSSVIDMTGTGTLSLDTTTNRPIATGTGLTTLGGGLTVTGAALTFAANSSTLTLGGSINTTALNIASNLEDFDTQNKRIGINTNAPLAALDVRPNLGTAPVASISGNTAFSNLVIDQSGTGDLFTASKSGATKFVVYNNGNIGFAGTSNFVSTLASAATSAVTWTLPNATGTLCLQSSASCGFAFGQNYFQMQNSGAIAPFSTTADLLLGGTATTSADFAFVGVDSNNPTASISAVTNGGNGNGLTLTSTNATIQSLNNNTLTIGGATTGNIIINSPTLLKLNTVNNGAITTGNGLTTLGGALTVSGTTVTLAGNSSIIDMTGTGTLSLDTTTNRPIATGTGLTTLGGALTVSGTTVTLAGNSSIIDMTGTGTLSLDTTTNRPIATGTGLTTLGGALTVSGTTVTLAGNSSVIDMTGTGTLSLDTTTNRPIATGTGLTTLGGALTVSGTTVTLAGNSSVIDMTGTGTLSLDTTTNRPIATGTGLTTLGGGLTVTGAALTFAANSSTLTLGGSINTTALNIASNLEDFDTQNNRIGINTNAPLAALDVRGSSGTTSVATVSGKTSFAALVVNNSGAGDIFTASAGGSTRFTVKSSGVVVIGNNTNGIQFDPTFSTDCNGGSSAAVYCGSARPTKTITLSAEYAGATLVASPSAIGSPFNGFMTASASTSANTTPNFLFENYYQWTSNLSSLQQYTVAVTLTLPQDFSGWPSSGNAMTIDYNTALTTSADNALDVYMYIKGDTSGVPVYFKQNNVSVAAETWTTVQITGAQLSGAKAWNLINPQVTLLLTLKSMNTVNYVQVGDIKINYLSAF